MDSLYYKLVEHDAACVIRLILKPDVDVAAFNEISDQLIDKWPVAPGQSVIVDLASSDYFGSVLLGLLVNIRQRVRAGRGEFALVSVPMTLQKSLRVSNLDRLFPLFSTLDDALAKIA
jgi:anti-sigma B factor antagonist